jgi:hypothetical protein
VNRGFTIEHASRVAKAVEYVQVERFAEIRERLLVQHPDEWTMLPLFTFTVDEIADRLNFSLEVVEQVLSKLHDASFAFKEGAGITFHCSDEPENIAGPRLKSYCAHRKYREKSAEWFGLCMSSTGPDVRFGVSLVFPWVQDTKMDEKTKDMRQPVPISQALQALMMGRKRAGKIGRNDPCPCGSGRKYKKCCENQSSSIFK